MLCIAYLKITARCMVPILSIERNDCCQRLLRAFWSEHIMQPNNQTNIHTSNPIRNEAIIFHRRIWIIIRCQFNCGIVFHWIIPFNAIVCLLAYTLCMLPQRIEYIMCMWSVCVFSVKLLLKPKNWINGWININV